MSNFLQRQNQRLHNPQVIALLSALVGIVLLFYFLGSALAPVITALFIAYLLDSLVDPLIKIHLPRWFSVTFVFSLFLFAVVLLVLVLAPVIAQQLSELLQEMPRITNTLKGMSRNLLDSATGAINPAWVEDFLVFVMEKMQVMATESLRLLVHGIPGLLSVVVYLFLVPFLVFFFLLDKATLRKTYCGYLPDEQMLLNRVVKEAEQGLGGYIRGKFWEMMLMGALAFFVFTFMEFQYALILGVLTGMSVLIPFVGVIIVAIPVALLGVFQWGLHVDATKPLAAYAVMQLVDANLFAPLILGESAKIHPTTFIIAVLVFGYMWGLVGVFFAVPLAVLVRSIYEAIASVPVDPPNPEDLDVEQAAS
uniref:Putative permease n=1 Tax=Magnetococcus massalia (strain MO-1) TaxID=451514 RepID=A0A1S7LQ73_MAGMO|nr:Putative permease [Candidatus Magnetococcus massalia]